MNRTERRKREREIRTAEKQRRRQRISNLDVNAGEDTALAKPSPKSINKSKPSKENAGDDAHLKDHYGSDDQKSRVVPELIYAIATPLLSGLAIAFIIYFLQAQRPVLALWCGAFAWLIAGAGSVALIHHRSSGKHGRRSIHKLWIGLAVWSFLGLAGATLIHHQYLKPQDISNSATAEAPRPPAAKPPETLKDYFDADFRNYYALYNPDFLIMPEGHPTYHTEVRLIFDWQSRTKFLALYLPSSSYMQLACEVPLEGHKMIERLLTENVEMEAHFPGERGTELKDLQFSGRIFIYHEDALMPSVIDDLTTRYKAKGLDVKFRGFEYVLGRNSSPARQAANSQQ